MSVQLPGIWSIIQGVPDPARIGPAHDAAQPYQHASAGIAAAASSPTSKVSVEPPAAYRDHADYHSHHHSQSHGYGPRIPPTDSTHLTSRNPMPPVSDVPRPIMAASPREMPSNPPVVQAPPRVQSTRSPHVIGQRHVDGYGLCYIYDDTTFVPCMIEGERVNPEWRTTKQGKARKRLPQACDRCRDKKIRCEGGNPCRKCLKLGESCIWSPSGRSNRRTSSAPRSASDMGGLPYGAHPSPSAAYPPHPYSPYGASSVSSNGDLAAPPSKRQRTMEQSPVTTPHASSVSGFFERGRHTTREHEGHFKSESAETNSVAVSTPIAAKEPLPAISREQRGSGQRSPPSRQSPVTDLPELLETCTQNRDDLLSTEDFVRYTNESISANADREKAWFTAIAFGSAYSGTSELKSLASALGAKWKRCEKSESLIAELVAQREGRGHDAHALEGGHDAHGMKRSHDTGFAKIAEGHGATEARVNGFASIPEASPR